MEEFETKAEVIYLSPREKEGTSIYTGAIKIAYVRNALELDHRRIERLYYDSEAHRRLVDRAFSKLKEGDSRDWDIPFKVLLGLRPKDFVLLSELFDEPKYALELIDLIDTDTEEGWIQEAKAKALGKYLERQGCPIKT